MAKIIKTGSLVGLYSENTTSAQHPYNVGPSSKTLGRRCTNACVRQVATLYYAWSNYMKNKIIHEKMFIGGHMYHVALHDWLKEEKC